jgi:hypothetical protein
MKDKGRFVFQVIMYKIVAIAKSRTHYCTTMKQDKKLSFNTKLGAVKILHIVLCYTT